MDRLMDRQTNRWTDNAISRVAFATEKVSPYGGKLSQPQFNHSPLKVGKKIDNKFFGSRPPSPLKN